MNDPLRYSEDQWQQELNPDQYAVLRKRATEQAFTGKLLHNKQAGVYTCGACKQPLFSSETKFDSGSGWPSFYDVIEAGSVKFVHDNSFGMERVEAVCANCGSHLGHVFDDAPDQPTGKRYCINSASLNFLQK